MLLILPFILIHLPNSSFPPSSDNIYNDRPQVTVISQNPRIRIAFLTILLILAAEQPDNQRPLGVSKAPKEEERDVDQIDQLAKGTKIAITQDKSKCFKSSIER